MHRRQAQAQAQARTRRHKRPPRYALGDTIRWLATDGAPYVGRIVEAYREEGDPEWCYTVEVPRLGMRVGPVGHEVDAPRRLRKAPH